MGAGLSCRRAVDRDDYTVDVFGDVAVVSLYADVDVLASVAQSTVDLKKRPREARRVVQEDAAPATPVRGPPVESLVVEENGLKFEIRPPNGLSVGLYLDARLARAWVRAHSAGRTVLNLFAYTCGFGVAARAGGAARVLNVDRSRKVLDWGERNYALNGLSVDCYDFVAGDAFEWIGRLVKKGEQFDLVVLDPPSFATSAASRYSAQRDFAKLVRSVAPLVRGELVACCNLAAVDAATVRGWVAQSMRVVEVFGAGDDFAQPSALKVVVARPA